MNRLQFIALLTPSLTSVLLVILAWLHSNTRISRVEVMLDQLRAGMSSLRAEMVALRDVVYREMVPLHERVAVMEERTK